MCVGMTTSLVERFPPYALSKELFHKYFFDYILSLSQDQFILSDKNRYEMEWGLSPFVSCWTRDWKKYIHEIFVCLLLIKELTYTWAIVTITVHAYGTHKLQITCNHTGSICNRTCQSVHVGDWPFLMINNIDIEKSPTIFDTLLISFCLSSCFSSNTFHYSIKYCWKTLLVQKENTVLLNFLTGKGRFIVGNTGYAVGALTYGFSFLFSACCRPLVAFYFNYKTDLSFVGSILYLYLHIHWVAVSLLARGRSTCDHRHSSRKTCKTLLVNGTKRNRPSRQSWWNLDDIENFFCRCCLQKPKYTAAFHDTYCIFLENMSSPLAMLSLREGLLHSVTKKKKKDQQATNWWSWAKKNVVELHEGVYYSVWLTFVWSCNVQLSFFFFLPISYKESVACLGVVAYCFPTFNHAMVKRSRLLSCVKRNECGRCYFWASCGNNTVDKEWPWNTPDKIVCCFDFESDIWAYEYSRVAMFCTAVLPTNDKYVVEQSAAGPFPPPPSLPPANMSKLLQAPH